jgi:hypothetical protein
MIGFTEGIVAALDSSGFRLKTDYGSTVLVITMTDGRRLGLRLGDRLHVTGGPSGDVFASSSISRHLADGSYEDVPDAPRRWRLFGR